MTQQPTSSNIETIFFRLFRNLSVSSCQPQTLLDINSPLLETPISVSSGAGSIFDYLEIEDVTPITSEEFFARELFREVGDL